jgi:hypothetical protein
MAAVLGHRAPYPLAGRAHEQGVFAASLEEVSTPNQLARRTQGPVLTGTGTASGTVLRSSQQGASVPLQLRGKRGFSFLEGEEAEAMIPLPHATLHPPSRHVVTAVTCARRHRA